MGKKCLGLIISLILMLQVGIAATVTIIEGDISYSFNKSAGYRVYVEAKDSEIKRWHVKSGNATLDYNNSFIMGNNDVEIEAIYDTYSINYSGLDGASVTENPSTYSKKTESFTLNNPTKQGYIFAGWTGTGLSNMSTTVTIPKGSSGNRTYTANWENRTDIPYTVNHWQQKVNGGTEQNSGNYSLADTQSFTGTTGANVTPVVNSYQGFTSPGAQTTIINADGSTVVNYYYTRNNYTITFDTVGGTEVSPITAKYEESITPPNNPSKTGYTFSGWTPEIPSTMPAENKTITANWILEAPYTITYLGLEGASVTGNPTSYTIETETFILNNPSKAGYAFLGWTGTDLDSASTTVMVTKGSIGNRSYTATWSEAISYAIGYDLGGGNVSSSNPVSYTVETETFTLNNPTKIGYRFNGWIGTGLDTASTTVRVTKGSTGNRNYTATWAIEAPYTIEYLGLEEANISGNPTSYTVETETFTLNNPSKEGYNFLGWIGTGLSSANTVVTINKGSTENRTYTATWSEAITYAIGYELDGGNVTLSNPTSYTVETETFTLNNPTRNGYTFAGWTGTGLGSVTQNVTINKGSTGNRSYIATWEINEYTIGYELNGGSISSSNPTSYTVETETFTLNNPTRNGYTFAGWTGTGLGSVTQNVTINKGSTGNRNYTATWEINEYTIEYNLGGGSVTGNPTSYTVEAETFTLNNPSKAGYTFLGWTGTGLSSATQNVTITKGSTGNRNYTANWSEAITYTIEYNLAGGSVTGNPTSYTAETATFILNNPTRDGYTFAGWTGTGLSSATQNVTIIKGSTGDRTYTATWRTGAAYTITYLGLEGASVSENPTNYTVETETFTLNNPTKAGYTFLGWTGTGLSSATQNVTITKGSTGNRNYTANWSEAITYTIEYNLAGGSVAGNPTSYTVETETFTLNNPTRAGYTFLGWTGTGLSSASTTVTVSKGSTGDRTYTATWSGATAYTITYDLAGGNVATENPTSYTAETTTFTLNNPTKAGYTFLGWTGTGLSSATQNVTITKGSTGNRNYTANWSEAITYTIEYNLAGGSVAGNPTSYTVETETFTLNNPTRAGYTFLGWTGTGLSSASTTVTVSKGSTGDRTYTATWSEAITYTIGYNLAGGSVTGNPTSYTVETTTFTLNNPTKAGYTFLGWTGTDLGSASTTVTVTKGSTGNRNYTANWSEAITYTIGYNLAGGSVTGNPASYTVETETFTLNNPTKAGYTFLGWTGTGLSSASTTVTVSKGSTGNRTYTATWSQAVTYTIGYELNGGSVATANPTSYTVETETFTLNNPTKAGYTFLGWTGTDLDSASTTVTIPTGSTGNRTYTATWEAVSYTIEYNLDGGSVATANPTSYTIETSTFTLNNPTRDGYNFLGWTGTDLASASMMVTITQGSTGNRSYTATWEEAYQTLASQVSIGDYVQYTPSIESYSVSSDDSGFYGDGANGSQVFTPSATTNWKVFKIEGDTVELISTNDVGKLTLRGYKGYNKLVDILNSIASAYVNPDYAVSGRSIGSTDQSVGTVAENLLAVIASNGSSVDYASTVPYTDTYHEADVQYIIDNNLLPEENLYDNQYAWLASRKAARGYSTNYYVEMYAKLFYWRGTTLEDAVGSVRLGKAKNSSDYTDEDSGRSVRVIVKLKPGIKVNGGDGSTTPWVLITE